MAQQLRDIPTAKRTPEDVRSAIKPLPAKTTRKQSPAPPSPWQQLTNPLAGFSQHLAALLASEFRARAVVVDVGHKAAPANTNALTSSLGTRYTGPISAHQLQQWARRCRDWWQAGTGLMQDSTVHVLALSRAGVRPLATTNRLLLDHLNTRHALLANIVIRQTDLSICLLLEPLTPARITEQAELLQAALPKIAGSLSLLLNPPAITSPAYTRPELSPAERRVLPLLLRRLSERAIAERLHNSRNTIHTHVKSIYLKYGVHSRKELLGKAGPSHARPSKD